MAAGMTSYHFRVGWKSYKEASEPYGATELFCRASKKKFNGQEKISIFSKWPPVWRHITSGLAESRIRRPRRWGSPRWRPVPSGTIFQFRPSFKMAAGPPSWKFVDFIAASWNFVCRYYGGMLRDTWSPIIQFRHSFKMAADPPSWITLKNVKYVRIW